MSGKRKLSDAAREYQAFYKLTRAEAEVVERIQIILDEALDQFDKGYAVDVESLVVTEARRIIALVAAGVELEAETKP